MRLIPRLGQRKPRSPNRRPPATASLRLSILEDRSLPSFGLGWAIGFGGAGSGGGSGIAVDAAGSSYVAGGYSGTADFDPNGTNPTSNHVLTSNGDAYVAKYLADGTFQWVTDVGLGGAGQIAVQGSDVYVRYNDGHGNGYVSRLDAGTGAIEWTTQILQSSNYGMVIGVAVNPSGVLYVSGNTGGGSASEAFVDRLDPTTGAVLWTQTSTPGSAVKGAVAVDNAGNAVVAGAFNGKATFGSTTLTASGEYVWKVNPSGGTVWAGAIGGVSTGGVAADGSGNVYLTGYWSGGSINVNPGSGKAVTLPPSNGQTDIFIVKLVPGTNGSLKASWAKRIGGYYTDTSLCVAVDGSGNVYTTGEYAGTVNFNPNSGTPHYLTSATGYSLYVCELNASGNYVAAASMGGPNNGNILTNSIAIAVDGGGNVFTTGYFSGTVNFSPTGGTYDLTSYNGGRDTFVSKLTQTSPQLALSRGPNVGVMPLTQAQINAADAAAIRDWAAAGLPAVDIARMKAVKADITTLGGNHLGAAELYGTEIAIDATADGWGWSVNPNAKPEGGRMDLLTVVEHELGHTIGLDSRFSGSTSDLMYAYLSPGVRRLPGKADMPAATGHVSVPRPSAEDQVDWLTAVATLKPKSNLYAGWLADGK